MPALDAHILVALVAVGQPFVLMLAEETRQRVAHPRDRAVFAKIFGPASAPPVTLSRPLEDLVVDMMPPERARKFG